MYWFFLSHAGTAPRMLFRLGIGSEMICAVEYIYPLWIWPAPQPGLRCHVRGQYSFLVHSPSLRRRVRAKISFGFQCFLPERTAFVAILPKRRASTPARLHQSWGIDVSLFRA